MLGNNMFAYCLNNPVAYSDSWGTDAKVCIAADGTIDEIPWWDHSPGGGGFVYHNIHIANEQNTEILGKHKKVVSGLLKINKARKMITTGVELLFIPVPSVATNLAGVGLITAGIIWGSFGLVEVIIWIDDLG